MNILQKYPLSLQRTFALIFFALIALGIYFRLYLINQSEFVFYDEGFYLNNSRRFTQLLDHFHPKNIKDFFLVFETLAKISLASGKSLWFLLVDSRVFFGLREYWAFSRIVSALSGILTIFLLYQFAKRFFQSKWIGLMSAGFLAILPSHVFYSRVGLQETFSTFLVLSSFYFYIFPKNFGYRTFVAGVFSAAAFFANYRLIILPVLFIFYEIVNSLNPKEKINVRKYIWFVLSFFSCVFLIGNIDDGLNTRVVFMWIFYQKYLAQAQFDFVNFLSYPYYIFRLENAIFAFILFSNIVFVIKRKWRYAFPFLLVCLQMIIFSLTSEKGARYICIVTPFMVMAVVYGIVFVLENYPSKKVCLCMGVAVVIMIFGLIQKSYAITKINSDYKEAMDYVLAIDPQGKVISTQKYVHDLYVKDSDRVTICPQDISLLFELYSQGYRYLILDPQAYISLTEDTKHFSPRLVGYLDFFINQVIPMKTFGHFDEVMMERFVFEHNENLLRSLKFLRIASKENLGVIRIYDLFEVVPMLKILISQSVK